jgi:hypothetical protein
MSHEWNGFVPSLMDQFSEVGLGKRAATGEEEEQLRRIKQVAEGNCHGLLYGLAAVGSAMAVAAPELQTSDVQRIGWLIQSVAALAADLAHIESDIHSYLKPFQKGDGHV